MVLKRNSRGFLSYLDLWKQNEELEFESDDLKLIRSNMRHGVWKDVN